MTIHYAGYYYYLRHPLIMKFSPSPKFARLLPLLLAPLFALPLTAAEPVQLWGSDLLKPILAAPLDTFAKSNEMVIQSTFEGTTSSRKALQEGKASIAIIALPEGAKLPEGYSQLPFAAQVVQVVVNSENPITEIRVEQLAAIFGIAGQKNFKQWSDMGLSGQWGSRSINLYAVRNDRSLALEIFKSSVLREFPVKPAVVYRADPKAVMTRIADDVSAIGLLPAMPLAGRVKSLAISTAVGEEFAPAYAPSAESVDFGDYPLTLNFVIVYNKADVKALKPILQFLLTDGVAEALEKADFLASPRKTRKENSMTIGLQ
ncbi:MAG: substrate-binding domain-containing protein [Verrucomicrobiota bacterium]|nr:substrate-binding domain-containing protein [Verrucomicrobiota bacterium]